MIKIYLLQIIIIISFYVRAGRETEMTLTIVDIMTRKRVDKLVTWFKWFICG